MADYTDIDAGKNVENFGPVKIRKKYPIGQCPAQLFNLSSGLSQRSVGSIRTNPLSCLPHLQESGWLVSLGPLLARPPLMYLSGLPTNIVCYLYKDQTDHCIQPVVTINCS